MVADFYEWLNSLGGDALRFMGLDGLADGIQQDLSWLRGTTAAEHKSTSKGQLRSVQKLVAGISTSTTLICSRMSGNHRQKLAMMYRVAVASSRTWLASDIEGSVNNVNDAISALGGNQDPILKDHRIKGARGCCPGVWRQTPSRSCATFA